MPQKRLLQVFLCHASQDKPAVRGLAQRLFAEGWIDPWLDEEKLLPGQDWRLKIEEAVETSDIVIICLSSNSVSKEGFVQKELRYAKDIALEKPDETIFLIPLRLDNCETPRGLRSYQWVDYFGENKEKAYSALLQSLKLRYDQKYEVKEEEDNHVENLSPKQEITSDVARSVAPSQNLSVPISIAQSFPAPGSRAEGITWDGMSLWLSDNSGVIFKVDPSGEVLDSVRSPEVTPQGLAWDGSRFWIYTTNHSFIYQIRIAGENVQTISSFRSPAQVLGGGITQDIAWDGENLWFANQFKVYKLDRSGKVLSSFTFHKNVTGLGWDSSNLWVAYNNFPEKSSLSRVDTNGKILETYFSPILEINALAWGDGSLWLLGSDSIGAKPMIYKLNLPAR
jgi:hypothetical protein